LAVPHTIKGKVWEVHPNVNLYADMTGRCTGDCGFCIAKVAYERPEIDSQSYYRAAERAIALLRETGISIQVTGGEPGLSPCFADIIDLIDSCRVNRPVLNTNGSSLTSKVIDRLNSSTFEHINISRHHWDERRAEQIMKRRPPLSNGELGGRIKDLRVQVRMQCNLIAGEMDSADAVLRYIDRWRAVGVREFAFAELTPLPRGEYYRDEIIDFVEAHPVDIVPIIETLTRNCGWRFLKFRGGVACYYEIWSWRDCLILFKRSNNWWLSYIDSMPGLIADFVLHTDGTLAGSWDKAVKVIERRRK